MRGRADICRTERKFAGQKVHVRDAPQQVGTTIDFLVSRCRGVEEEEKLYKPTTTNRDKYGCCSASAERLRRKDKGLKTDSLAVEFRIVSLYLNVNCVNTYLRKYLTTQNEYLCARFAESNTVVTVT